MELLMRQVSCEVTYSTRDPVYSRFHEHTKNKFIAYIYGITDSKFSFGEVFCRIYGRKFSFTCGAVKRDF